MKNLVNISGSGLKGQSFNHDVGPVTVFQGPFHTGKTGRVMAVRLLLVGHDPREGKKEGSTYRYATGDVMRVGGTWTDGTKTVKEWTRTRKEGSDSSVKQTKGTKDQLVPVDMLDPDLWFKSGTGQDRLDYVFSLVDLKALGYTADKVMAAIGATRMPDEVPVETAKTWAESFAVKAKEFKASNEGEKGSVQQLVEAILGHLKATLKASRETVQRMEGSSQAAVQLEAITGAPPRDVSAELSLAEAEWKTWTQKKAQLDTVTKTRDQNEERIKALELTLSAGADQVGDRDELQKRITKGETWLSKHVPRSTSPDYTIACGDVDRFNDNISKLESEIEQLTEDLKEALKGQACPTCASKGSSWKTSIKKKAAAEVASRRAQITALAKGLKVAEKDRAEAKKVYDIEEADAERADAWRNSVRDAKKQLAELTKDMTAHTAAQTEHTTRVADRVRFNKEAVEAERNLVPVNKELWSITVKLQELREENNKWVAHQTIEKQKASARIALKQARDKAECVQAVVDSLVAEQERMITTAMKSILEPVNRFAQGFVPGEFAWHDGDFGYWEPSGEWVKHSVMSGTEQAITYAGFAVALCQGSPYKVVILDRLDVNASAKRKLFERMVQLVGEGYVHQVFATHATDADTPPLKIDGVTVIQMPPRKEAV